MTKMDNVSHFKYMHTINISLQNYLCYIGTDAKTNQRAASTGIFPAAGNKSLKLTLPCNSGMHSLSPRAPLTIINFILNRS